MIPPIRRLLSIGGLAATVALGPWLEAGCGASDGSPSDGGTLPGHDGGLTPEAGIEAGKGDAAAGASDANGVASSSRARADAGDAGGNGAVDGGKADAGDGGPTLACGAALPAPSVPGVVLQVDVCENRHTIPDAVYGVTFFWDTGSSTSDQATLQATQQFATDIRLPVNRLGGDATTRYNWQVDSTNSGEDWYFMAGDGMATPVPGASNDALVTLDENVGAATVLTIPIIDFIDKGSATSCSYPSNEYPTQDSWNPYVTVDGNQCGNGKSGGTPITDTHVSNHDISNTPAIQQAWVEHLVSKFGTAAAGGVAIYEMDNEPTGWPGVHFDVRPTAPTCQELIEKTQTYASAVKSADPTALVLGPDDIAPADVFACMGTTNGQAYLTAMAEYEQTNGVRILDYYAMHYPGCCSGDPIANAAAHIQTHLGWIAADYPGTKLAYDEYNWGANGDSSTFPEAILAVDGLGLFGSAGVDLASFWGLDVTTPTAAAFRLYRDFDGNGSAFGDISVSAVSSDATQLHVYAAARSSDDAVTIVVVNKTSDDVAGVLALSNHHPAGPAAVFLFSPSEPTSIVAQPAVTITNPGAISMTFPAGAATLVVVP